MSAQRSDTDARADSHAYQKGTCALWTVPIDGGSPVLLARDVFEASLFEIAWSPDGSQIAFLREESCPHACNVRVFVVPATGGKARPIGPVIGEIASLFWLPSSAVSAELGGKASR